MDNFLNLPLAEAVSYIEELSNAKRTGTLYLASDGSTVARLTLSNGAVTSAMYSRQRGLEALWSIFRTTHFRRVFFLTRNSANGARSDPELPPPDQILALIRQVSGVPSTTTANKTQKTIETPSAQSQPIDVRRVIELITPELAVHIGPIAGLVCEGYFEDVTTHSDAIHAVNKVAGEIDDAAAAAEFKRSVKAKLQNL